MDAIRIEGLCKDYGKLRAVDKLSLSIHYPHRRSAGVPAADEKAIKKNPTGFFFIRLTGAKPNRF